MRHLRKSKIYDRNCDKLIPLISKKNNEFDNYIERNHSEHFCNCFVELSSKPYELYRPKSFSW